MHSLVRQGHAAARCSARVLGNAVGECYSRSDLTRLTSDWDW